MFPIVFRADRVVGPYEGRHLSLSMVVGGDAYIAPLSTESFPYVARADVGIGPYERSARKKEKTGIRNGYLLDLVYQPILLSFRVRADFL